MRGSRRRASLLAIAALAACFASSVARVRGDEPSTKEPPKPPSKTALSDDALLKDLDNELLEGAGDLSGPKSKKSADKKSNSPESNDEDAAGMPEVDHDPLTSIGERMRSAESLMPEHARRREAEALQAGI